MMTDSKRRVSLTVFYLAGYLALHFVPTFGLNFENLNELASFFETDSGYRGSVLPWAPLSFAATGLNAFFGASLCIEILACIIPAWRPLRTGIVGRTRLHRFSLMLTVLIVMFVGMLQANRLLHLQLFQVEIYIVFGSSAIFQLAVVISQVAGTFICIWLAGRITRVGLINGFALLLGTSFAVAVVDRLILLCDLQFNPPISVRDGFFRMVPTIAAILGAVLLMRARARLSHPADHTSLTIVVRPLIAGLIPVIWGLAFFEIGRLLRIYFKTLETVWLIIGIGLVVTVVATFVLGRLFYRPAKIESDLIASSGAAMRVALKKTLVCMGTLSLAFYLALVWGPLYLDYFNLFLCIQNGLPFLILTAFILDVIDSFKYFKKHDDLVAVAFFDRVYLADAAMDLLEKHQITHLTHNKYLRGIYHFFSPYLPMTIMVPSEAGQPALDILAAHPGFLPYLVENGKPCYRPLLPD